jgi:hypothetical protein
MGIGTIVILAAFIAAFVFLTVKRSPNLPAKLGLAAFDEKRKP